MAAVGTQIDKLFVLREKISKKEKEVKDLKEKLDNMKLKLIEDMRKQGIDKASGQSATVSVKSEIQPVAQDWDEFFPWMYENKMGHLMFKRISPVAFREILELRGGESIPGLGTFEKETLSIRRRTT